MNRTPDYDCPKCDNLLVNTPFADWRCSTCDVLIEEHGNGLRVDVEPDAHGSRVETYERNHAQQGQSHE